eukprot:TRINITY_DN31400_c0_g1_i10.p1 TRINITY_DN31400_c0_g1~~TRINITY_DN31400_c0_g1_i10.p1  ORF type:complete len:264 (+),score=6.66 TRINITY_DN31400_c0_g1_i10:30-821(+)
MLAISLSIIILHVLIIYWIRSRLKTLIKNEDYYDVLLDGLFAFELGCLAQEQGIILQYYGITSWSICLFCVVVWQTVGWPGYSASPIPNLLTLSVWGVLKTGFMLAASLISYRYMSLLWEFEVTELHKGRAYFTSLDTCVYPFTSSSLWVLASTELIGSLVLSVFSIILNRNPFLVNNDPYRFIRGVLMSLAVVIVVVLGMDISGAMYNPTLATLLLGGCKGQGNVDHILIYWLAPTLGAWVAPYLVPEKSMQTTKKAKLKSN